MYTPIQPSRLYEQIVAQIESRFKRGELNAGDRLPPERELAEQFGVSRTAVREAIKALQEKGLVEIRPGRGTFIADVADRSTDVVRDSLGLMVESRLGQGLAELVQVRSILEPEIAAIAAESATPQDLQLMRQTVATMESAMDKPDVFVEADLAFHLALARATQNSLIPILLDPIIDLLRRQRQRMSMVPGGSARGQFHHRLILAAVEKRDTQGAWKAMKAHMEQITRDSQALAQVEE